jgi:hypothetical protein
VKWPPAWDTVSCQLTKGSAVAAVTRGPKRDTLKNPHCVRFVARKRIVEIIIRLRTLVCACQ